LLREESSRIAATISGTSDPFRESFPSGRTSGIFPDGWPVSHDSRPYAGPSRVLLRPGSRPENGGEPGRTRLRTPTEPERRSCVDCCRHLTNSQQPVGGDVVDVSAPNPLCVAGLPGMPACTTMGSAKFGWLGTLKNMASGRPCSAVLGQLQGY